jgi:hypothetical protein
MKTIVVMALLCFWTGSVFAASESGSECRELLVAKCQTCHYLERVCSKVGKKSKRRWKATVKRMVKRRGAELEVDEQMLLVQCLSAPDQGVLKECGITNSSKP